MKRAFKQQNIGILSIVPVITVFSTWVPWSTQSIDYTIILNFCFGILCSALAYLLSHKNQSKHQEIKTLATIKLQLNMALEAANMSMWNWNLLTNQVTLSKGQEHLFGLESGEYNITYETFLSLIHSEDRESWEQIVNRAIKEKIAYRYEYRVIWADSSVYWIESKGKVIYNEVGEVVQIMGTVRDISDAHNERCLRKIAEAKIQTLNTELEQRILKRTARLSKDNQQLSKIIAERQLFKY